MEKKRRRKWILLSSVAAALAALWIFTVTTTGNGVMLAPREGQPAGLAQNQKLIALTFDDGPGKFTQYLMDELKKRDCGATFFLVGKKVGKYPQVVDSMARSGFLIGSHTYTHQRLTRMSSEEQQEELRKTDDAIEAACGLRPQWLRPPHGSFWDFKLKDTNKFIAMWSGDTVDWKLKDEEKVYQRIKKLARDGAVLLMHDIHETTVKAVLRAVDDLQKEGYQFVRLDDLLQRGGASLEQGRAYKRCQYGKEPAVTHLPFVIS